MNVIRLLFIGLCLLASTAWADNWPGWRGPLGDGTTSTPGPTHWDGESGNSSEANSQLASAIPFGFGAMILVVIFLFNALRQPLVIWSVVPLALVGVVFGLIVMGVPFEFMAIL